LLPFVFLLGIGVPLFVLHSRRNASDDVRNVTGTVNAFLTDSFQGLQTVLAFGYGKRRREELRSLGIDLASLEQKQKASQAIQNGLNGLLSAGAALTLLAGGVTLAGEGVIEVAAIPLVVAIGYLGLDPLTGMTDALNDFNTAIASAGRLFELMDRPQVIGEPEDPVEPEEITPSLRFENVSFRYPSVNGNGAMGPVLKDLNFAIRPGETVGLAGPSGAGKLTIVNLLVRFQDPDAGRILLGGTALNSLRLEDIRSHIAVVSQQTYIFNTTIRENILIGKPDTTEEELESAVRKANLEELVRSLPDGLDTEVGEMGSRLSGGEQQRIAIARAFLKDAPILILDEATSDLDAENELAIRYILDTLMQDRTTLIIAHRLSTIKDADRILVLDNGRIAEQGGHDELLASNGVYTRLFSRQQDELDDRAVNISLA
ncbi:MAG TPA: ABC transporter ATP-binding protein, partial [bacterium]|nr:ABC transporter ATP-binding protein [bacterium]